MRGLREDRCDVGSPAHVPGVRRHPLLRRLAESTRHETRPRNRTSRHRLGRAGRAVAVLLSGRSVRGVLTNMRRGSFERLERLNPVIDKMISDFQ